MDEKKLDQAQNLEDEQLEDVSGGGLRLSACSRMTSADADDETRDMSFHASAPQLDDEGEDGRYAHGIHYAPIWPTGKTSQ